MKPLAGIPGNRCRGVGRPADPSPELLSPAHSRVDYRAGLRLLQGKLAVAIRQASGYDRIGLRFL